MAPVVSCSSTVPQSAWFTTRFRIGRGSLARPEIIGKAMGCTTWIANPQDPNVLMPIGAVGELLCQGPILARGYLNNPVKTNDAFLSRLRLVA